MNEIAPLACDVIKPIEGRFTWKGPEVDYEKQGMHIFSDAEIMEIDTALAHLKSLGEIDFPQITPKTFPLETLEEALRGRQGDLRSGLGFVLFRGLPIKRYPHDDLARIFYGLGSYLGVPNPQSYQGELLGHVMDVSDVEQKARAYHAGGKMEMHTDARDIVALMCLRTPESGGESRITSSAALHNALLETRPDLVAALYEGFLQRRMEKDAKYGNGRVLSNGKIPVFALNDGEFSCRFLGRGLRRAIEAGDVPDGGIELEAVDALEEIALSPDYYLDMSFRQGDMQFLNNNLILHGRTEYTDKPAFYERRYLIRLWLDVPEWPELKANYVFDGAADQDIWLSRRTHLGELPSAYLRKVEDMRLHGEKID
ncbi:MAG: taurine catabolism dioxygenase TauD [Confluentimicrobium sp.]|uniref:TauD/TfdA family dioxygenase n=1 Tax=Actibacterium sp. TaxID=1872125 RepID=UPI000C4EB149|nr:TauD/TfdA family dioxygenase [Actibacterium sp.]MBC58911.1 taurine catabolism dioxygenase TauD [Actibacterium sp.]|tara:strand:- start:12391 stop:13500 length:1110 start_codon:yes stop_codon:yes gene_type:complete